MSNDHNEEASSGLNLSNKALGLLLAGAVIAWFLIGLVYAILVN